MIGLLFSGLFGFLLGSIFGSPIIGMLIGGWLGNKFDKALQRIIQPFNFNFQSNSSRSQSQQVFFEVTFAVMGCLAKSDGVVSQEEINIAKNAMNRCNLNKSQREEAKRAFTKGKSANYDLHSDLLRFRNQVGHNMFLLQLFLDFQLQTARADGGISNAKEKKLEEICRILGINTQSSQNHSYNYHSQQNTNDLNESYKTLGLNQSDSKQTIKQKYRKLMAEHHPDKLIAKGLPQEMIDIANEKTSKIQQAYRKIAKARGIK